MVLPFYQLSCNRLFAQKNAPPRQPLDDEELTIIIYWLFEQEFTASDTPRLYEKFPAIGQLKKSEPDCNFVGFAFELFKKDADLVKKKLAFLRRWFEADNKFSNDICKDIKFISQEMEHDSILEELKNRLQEMGHVSKRCNKKSKRSLRKKSLVDKKIIKRIKKTFKKCDSMEYYYMYYLQIKQYYLYNDWKHLKQAVEFIESFFSILEHSKVEYESNDINHFLDDLKFVTSQYDELINFAWNLDIDKFSERQEKLKLMEDKKLILNINNENFEFDPFGNSNRQKTIENYSESQETLIPNVNNENFEFDLFGDSYGQKMIKNYSESQETVVLNENNENFEFDPFCLESILNLIMLIKFFVISFFRNESDEDEEEEKFYASSVLNNVEEPGVQYPSDSLWEWNFYSTNLCLLCNLRNIFSNSLDLLIQLFSQATEEFIDLYKNENQVTKTETGNSCRTVALYSDRSPKIIVIDELKDIMKKIVLNEHRVTKTETGNSCRTVALYSDRSPKISLTDHLFIDNYMARHEGSYLKGIISEYNARLKELKIEMVKGGLRALQKMNVFREFKNIFKKVCMLQDQIEHLFDECDFIILNDETAYDNMDVLPIIFVDIGKALIEEARSEPIHIHSASHFSEVDERAKLSSIKIKKYLSELWTFLGSLMDKKKENQNKIDSFWMSLLSRIEDVDLVRQLQLNCYSTDSSESECVASSHSKDLQSTSKYEIVSFIKRFIIENHRPKSLLYDSKSLVLNWQQIHETKPLVNLFKDDLDYYYYSLKCVNLMSNFLVFLSFLVWSDAQCQLENRMNIFPYLGVEVDKTFKLEKEMFIIFVSIYERAEKIINEVVSSNLIDDNVTDKIFNVFFLMNKFYREACSDRVAAKEFVILSNNYVLRLLDSIDNIEDWHKFFEKSFNFLRKFNSYERYLEQYIDETLEDKF